MGVVVRVMIMKIFISDVVVVVMKWRKLLHMKNIIIMRTRFTALNLPGQNGVAEDRGRFFVDATRNRATLGPRLLLLLLSFFHVILFHAIHVNLVS